MLKLKKNNSGAKGLKAAAMLVWLFGYVLLFGNIKCKLVCVLNYGQWQGDVLMTGNIASFSLLALYGTEWLASCPDCFMSRGKKLSSPRDGRTSFLSLPTITSHSLNLWPFYCSDFDIPTPVWLWHNNNNNNNNKGATGTISKTFRKYGSNIPGKHEVKEPQKTAILGTAHILRKGLT